MASATPATQHKVTPNGESARARPHALANELTRDPDVQAQNVRSGLPADAAEKGKRTGGHLAIALGVLMLIAIVLAAMITSRWELLGLAGLLILPYMIVLLAPVWLASSSKIAQDRAAAKKTAMPPAPRR